LQRWGVIDEPTGAKSWVFSDQEIGGLKTNDGLNNTKVPLPHVWSCVRVRLCVCRVSSNAALMFGCCWVAAVDA
jgi:hypothetical protein